ncbi:hypothetical protein [Streptomyces mexicanus]|jgi:hypothetical protein|uniref:Uncharacterized protein n=1 Tax=Streptomyces mexicanus TaxID=178566 RepID=A0A7X1I655_9ACTN|nr:hypothetical protein [Streptomyces mexicanus]MBC2869446.1 hypothetical protein [Streptomyces mexicanus]
MTLPVPTDPQETAPLPVTVSSAQTAVADMRATARWTVAATAAVGGVLLGGLPFAAIGKLHGGGDLALAVGGLAVAMAGVFWVIWATGEVLTPRFVTLTSLDGPGLAGLRAAVQREPEAFFGPFGASAAELDRSCRHHTQTAARIARLLVTETDDVRRARLTHWLGVARSNAAHARARRRALLELVHAWQVRATLRRARIHTLLASLLVVAGAVLFLLATDGG